ncbi:hypothetical protein V6N11_071500 [Hibiscus sabdariffa]|uniref:Reverse transcriptase domain-containing protein n=1 Tax=Hibiscus sabdariffa TaxID=183260 RepID=A0ABR2U096_9ROSI
MRVTIQLADRAIIYPEGLLENVLVKVNELVFPADFYVIDMESDRANTSPEIVLGRPFLGTTNTKIEVRSGLLTMEFDGDVVKFDVYKAMRQPDIVASSNFIDIIDLIGLATEEFIETNYVSNPCRELEDSKEEETIKELEKHFFIESNPQFLPSNSKISHSFFQTPDIELKPPPEQLREGYALSMIVSKLKKIRRMLT